MSNFYLQNKERLFQLRWDLRYVEGQLKDVSHPNKETLLKQKDKLKEQIATCLESQRLN